MKKQNYNDLKKAKRKFLKNHFFNWIFLYIILIVITLAFIFVISSFFTFVATIFLAFLLLAVTACILYEACITSFYEDYNEKLANEYLSNEELTEVILYNPKAYSNLFNSLNFKYFAIIQNNKVAIYITASIEGKTQCCHLESIAKKDFTEFYKLEE